MKNKYFAVYACDTDEKGLRPGPETFARLEKFLEILPQETGTKNFVILGAGRKTTMTKRLSTLMHEYIGLECVKRAITSPSVITTNVQAWGSLDESILIRNLAIRRNVTDLTVISSGYHIPRLKLIWWLIAPSIKVTFVSVQIKRKRIDYLETLKMMWAIIKFFLYRTRLKESRLFIE